MNDDKKTYVIIETESKRKLLRDDYNFMIVRWEDFTDEVRHHLESSEVDKQVKLTFTIKRFTDAEYESYCEENEIETP